MERVAIVSHAGTPVIRIDLSGLRGPEEVRPVIERAAGWIHAQPPGAALVLLEVGGVSYSLRLARLLCDAARANSPFVRARALVGAPDAVLPTVRELARITDRPIEAFADPATALDWLVEQGAGA